MLKHNTADYLVAADYLEENNFVVASKFLRKMALESNWIWMPHPAHFIGARDCKFFLSTCIGGRYIVSTVGE